MRASIKTLLCAVLVLPAATGWAIEKPEAISIAEQAAGCSKQQVCQSRARPLKGNWSVVVSYIYGYRDNGEPVFVPGGLGRVHRFSGWQNN